MVVFMGSLNQRKKESAAVFVFLENNFKIRLTGLIHRAVWIKPEIFKRGQRTRRARSFLFWHFITWSTVFLVMAGVIHGVLSAHSANRPTEGASPPTMAYITHSASVKPPLPAGTPSSIFSASPTSSSFTDVALPPPGDVRMQVHAILIVGIFCVVCLLLLTAFVYAFCLHCSIGSSPKDLHLEDATWNLEREDATYRCTSSENHSVGNTVWLDYWGLSVIVYLLLF